VTKGNGVLEAYIAHLPICTDVPRPSGVLFLVYIFNKHPKHTDRRALRKPFLRSNAHRGCAYNLILPSAFRSSPLSKSATSLPLNSVPPLPRQIQTVSPVAMAIKSKMIYSAVN